MRHLPDDTITLTIGDQQFETLFGDPDFPTNARGGNDTITVSIGVQTFLDLVGDGATLDGHSHGGNDTLAVSLAGFEDTVIVDGDAQSMSDHARGGNDTLHASSKNSVFTGFSLYGDTEGVMSDHAKGGNDNIVGVFGGRSSNTLVGDGATMTGHAHGGNDVLLAFEANQDGSAGLYGDAITMTDHARGGNDVLTFIVGSEAENGGATLYGDAGLLEGDARGGNDVLRASFGTSDPNGSQSVALIGDADTMSGNARGGNDVLIGGSHNDTLVGDALHYAPSAPGSIKGGNDILNGGAGNDQLWGGPNNDKFVFDKGSGQDVIHDFDQGNRAVGSTAPEHDVINLHDYGFASWKALSSLISDDSSGNAVIHLTANDSIALVGVHTADLHARDFTI